MRKERIGDVAETLLDYFEHNKTFQGEEVMEVAAAGFTDPAQLRQEIELIFRRVPLMLALSCEMPRPGDYKAMQIAGRPVLIARDESGVTRAFLNVCAHRWAPVAAEGYGNCPRFRFTCPFHGWTYGADGRLVGIADERKFGTVDKSARGLRDLPCEERHGMIFVGLTSGMPLDLEAYYGDLLDELAAFGLAHWTYVGRSEFDAPNWKIVLANFFESYHFAVRHPKTVARRWISNLSHYEGFGPHMRIGYAEHTIAKLRELPREQWGREADGYTFMRYLFPNVTASLFPFDLSIFTQLLPGSTPGESRLVTLYVRKNPPRGEAEREQLKKDLQHNIEVANITLRDEDLAIGIATQRSLESGAHESLLYGRNERGPQYFHEWVNWYLRNDPSAAKPVM
jgi:phenylpropionate dioxygenase-like ring-hydroxylating dioxygenase large terminal subunit